MKRISVLLAVTAAALAAWPAVSSAGTYHGVVVGKQRGVLLVAGQSGQVRSVSTSSPAAVGSRVAVSGHNVRVIGRSHTARIRGVVVRRTKHTVFLSAGHRLLAVHSSRALMSASDQPPAAPTNGSPTTTAPTNMPNGSTVAGTVTLSPTGEVEDDSLQTVGSANSTQITATVTNIVAGSVTVTVNGQSLTIPLPAGLTLPSTLVGQTITLTLTFPNGQTQGEPDDQGEDNNSQGQSFSGGSTGSGGSGDQNGGDQNGGGDNG